MTSLFSNQLPTPGRETLMCTHVREGRKPRKTMTSGARQWLSFLSLLIVFSVIVFFVVATPRCPADANASPPLLPERQYKALRVGHLDVEMRDHATKFTAALISPINRGFRITSKQHGWSPRCRRWGTRDTRRLSDSEQTDQKL